MVSLKDAKRFVRQNSAVRCIIEPPYTIAIVELNSLSTDFAKKVMVGKGLSTCSASDKWNEERGKGIARGRAEVVLARKVMRADKLYDWIMNNENNTGDTATPTCNTR